MANDQAAQAAMAGLQGTDVAGRTFNGAQRAVQGAAAARQERGHWTEPRHASTSLARAGRLEPARCTGAACHHDGAIAGEEHAR